MKPYIPMRRKIKEVRAKIEKQYFDSSLYVVEEENVPSSQLQTIVEEKEED